MRTFTRLTATAAPLDRANVDTDAIIPVDYCINRERPHFDEGLFRRWRLDDAGEPRAAFVLNQPRFAGAGILVAGPNFGCGSSREMAVWALADAGIRCVIAPSFGEIFYDNCFQNGVLPAIVDAAAGAALLDALARGNSAEVTVDLETRTIRGPDGVEVPLHIDDLRAGMLIEGLDPIASTLAFGDAIEAFESQERSARPWVQHPGAG
ncbi:MAG: 3-isopropylmalate dehydratase small subunit [Chromatiales bacterium]|nr:3-isopropylmalate dehydratase small subunit [Chromatiales bacterium]